MLLYETAVPMSAGSEPVDWSGGLRADIVGEWGSERSDS